MTDPNSPVPSQYVTMIARILPVEPSIIGVEAQLEANRNQAQLFASIIWRHAFHAGAAYGLSIANRTNWLVVTPEERDHLVASLNPPEES